MVDDTSFDVWVDVKGDSQVTFAEVDAFIETGGLIERRRIRASAKREPQDKNDHEIGSYLAAGRALEQLGLKLQRHAMGLVRNQDNIKNGLINNSGKKPFDAKSQAQERVKGIRALASRKS